MKKLFVAATAVLGLLAPLALAEGPHIEPGPVLTLSDDAVEVARILLNPQLKKCVSKIQMSNYDVGSYKITAQHLKPGSTKYNFSGVAIVGGDVAVGQVNLSVYETRTSMMPFGTSITYTCKVTLPQRESTDL